MLQESDKLGAFTVEISNRDQARERWVTPDALVDTGASITSMSGSVLRELGVRLETSERFRFGQARSALCRSGTRG